MAIYSLSEYWNIFHPKTYFFDIFPIIEVNNSYINHINIGVEDVAEPVYSILDKQYNLDDKIYNICPYYLDTNKLERLKNYKSTDEVITIESGTSVVSHGFRNFWHFVMEVSPRIMALEKTGFSGYYIFFKKDFPSYIYNWMNYLSIPKDRVLLTSKSLFVKNVKISVPVVHGNFNFNGFSGNLLKSVRQFFLEPVRERIPRIKDRKIFITRKSGRHLLNEEAVMTYLKKFGLEVVDMNALSLADQIILAASTHKMAGIHGAGMVHSLFMPRFSSILEMFSHRYVMPCMHEVVKRFGHNYYMCVERVPHNQPKDPSKLDQRASFYGHTAILESMLRDFMYMKPDKNFMLYYNKCVREESQNNKKIRNLVKDYLLSSFAKYHSMENSISH